MRTGEEIAAAARGCVGARFRPHRRDPAYGLDCVGVAAVAFDRAIAGTYPMRGGSVERIAAAARVAGLVPIVEAEARPGDLLLLAAGRGQFHLAVLTATGFVHADASLRRVVETPGWPRWPLLGMWRGGE